MAHGKKVPYQILVELGSKYSPAWRDAKAAARKRRTKRWPPVKVVIAEARAFLENYESEPLEIEEACDTFYALQEIRECKGFNPSDEPDLMDALVGLYAVCCLSRTAIAAVQAHLHTTFSEVDFSRPEELRVETYLPGCPVVPADADENDYELHPRRRALH